MTLAEDVKLDEFVAVSGAHAHTRTRARALACLTLARQRPKTTFLAPTSRRFAPKPAWCVCCVVLRLLAHRDAPQLALRERRMKVVHADFKKAKDKVMYQKKEGVPAGLYL